MLLELRCLMQVTETQSENPMSLGQQRTAQQTAIIAFTARYYSNLPFQDPQPTLLKEYLPGARSLGCNELQLLNHLHTLPEQKWRAAYAPLSSDPPIVPLLGRILRRQLCLLSWLSRHCSFSCMWHDAISGPLLPFPLLGLHAPDACWLRTRFKYHLRKLHIREIQQQSPCWFSAAARLD